VSSLHVDAIQGVRLTASFDLPGLLPGLVEKTGYAISVAERKSNETTFREDLAGCRP